MTKPKSTADWILKAQAENKKMFETYGLYGRIDEITVKRVMTAYFAIEDSIPFDVLPANTHKFVYIELKKGKYYEN
jgi:hypothetical protein